MRRRFLLSLAGLAVVVLAALLALPLWLGVAVRWAGAPRGLHFESYERLGYARFVLRGVEFRRRNVTVTVSRLEANTPLVWLWHRARSRSNFVVAEAWTVTVVRSTAVSTASPTALPAGAATAPHDGAVPTVTPSGWVPVRATLRKVAAELGRWLPEARVGRGHVVFPGGELTVAAARWHERMLAVDTATYRALAVSGELRFPADADLISANVHSVDDTTTAQIESRGPLIAASLRWNEQPATLRVDFDNQGWQPREAHLSAPGWDFPGERVKLGTAYARLNGDAAIDWNAGKLVAAITAKGVPLAKTAVPPLDVTLRGSGDTHAFTIEAFHVDVPGVVANLTAPVTIDRSGNISGSGATFAMRADLSRQPWISATGTATGEARLVHGIGRNPTLAFQIAATNVAASGLALRQVEAQGRFTWPDIEIADAKIVGASGETLGLRGGWNFRTKRLRDVAVKGEVRRASLARWLPAQPQFERVAIDATASGTLANVEHAGRAEIAELRVPGLNPLHIAANWRGTAATLTALDAQVTAGRTTLVLAGAVDHSRARINRFTFTNGGTERLRLEAPTAVHWSRGADSRPTISVDACRFTGADASLVLAAAWGPTGNVKVAARNLSSDWLSDLIPSRGPPIRVGSAAITGDWDGAPMTFAVTSDVSIDLGEGRVAAINLAGRGDRSGIRIEALRAVEGAKTVLTATGRLPVTVQPAATPLLRIDPKGEVALEASTVPEAVLWRELTQLTGIELGEPEARAHLTGTWERPEGSLTLRAAKIGVDRRRFQHPIPTIEQLDFHATGDRSGVTIDSCSVRVEGQAIRASGKLAIRDGRWDEALKAPLATLEREADGHVEIPDAQIPAFAAFLPAALAPQGRLQLNLEYHRGELAGELNLRGAASRPLGPLGVLQDINADVQLAGRSLRLANVSAKAGGQPVRLTGQIELPRTSRPVAGAAWSPKFDVAVRGENLPFVRQAGLLLRGDLDLKLQSAEATGDATTGPARISGKVTLRDSLFLSDVRAFLPKGGAANPARRPPYFSITAPPLNQWTLNVELVGDRFLRLRTTVFNGLASARFHLGGTLSEPRAIGDVTIDEGQVLMPFATFDVKQAAVRLTEADPFEPTIYLRGTTRRYGYDIAMEIDGRASAPNMVFTSSPALDSEQVLLMVMTGAVPSNDISTSNTQRFASVGRYLGQSLIGSLVGGGSGADRLSISSGEKISQQGKETYDIEYKLSDRWTAVGQYNEFDEYTAGLKWRVLPRKLEHEPPPNTEVARGQK